MNCSEFSWEAVSGLEWGSLPVKVSAEQTQSTLMVQSLGFTCFFAPLIENTLSI